MSDERPDPARLTVVQVPDASLYLEGLQVSALPCIVDHPGCPGHDLNIPMGVVVVEIETRELLGSSRGVTTWIRYYRDRAVFGPLGMGHAERLMRDIGRYVQADGRSWASHLDVVFPCGHRSRRRLPEG